MIRIGDYVFNNLQEAVKYMSCLIGDATDIVKNVVGKVNEVSLLPDYKSQILGSTYAVGINAPYSYYVATTSGWLFLGVFPKAGPAGDDGKNGNSLFFTNIDGNTQTTTININNIYNPDSLPITAGNLILMINDNGTFIFSITTVSGNVAYVSYLTTLSGIPGKDGSPGAPGAPGKDGKDAPTYISIDFPNGQETVTYDTTDGLTLVGQTRLTDTNGETNDVATNISIPIFAGDGISIDAKTDGTGVEIRDINVITLSFQDPANSIVIGINGAKIGAKYDYDGNEISTTYVTKAYIDSLNANNIKY